MKWAKGKSACSFWGAQLIHREEFNKSDMPLKGCQCRYQGRPYYQELSKECIIQDDTIYFSPPRVLEKYPHVQLWDPRCKCVKRYLHERDRPLLAEKIQGVAAVDFCWNLFAAADQANSYHPKYWSDKWKTDMQKRVNETLSMHRCQKQLPDPKKIEDLLESGGSLTLKQAWKKVCYDECEDLLNELRGTMETVVETGRLRKNSWSEICVEHVVKKVESHLLGCCGRSCGWNGWTCASSG